MELKPVFIYDADGFFDHQSCAQPDPVTGEYLMPPNSTAVEPVVEDDCFAKWDGEKWVSVAMPRTAADCVKLGAVSHYTHTPHDERLRQLFQVLTEGSETHRIERGEDLSWRVVEIPEKTPEEKHREQVESRIAELKGKLAETDYVVIKIAEGEASVDEYQEVLANRKIWRAELNELGV